MRALRRCVREVMCATASLTFGLMLFGSRALTGIVEFKAAVPSLARCAACSYASITRHLDALFRLR